MENKKLTKKDILGMMNALNKASVCKFPKNVLLIVDEGKCYSCNKDIDKEDVFCINCGFEL